MKKKLIIVWLTSLMVLFSSISVYADDVCVNEDVRGDFFERHVVINGEEIINYNLQYPFVMYSGSTYFPLSPEICEILGLKAETDWESHTLKLLKTESTRKNISSNWLKNNNVDLTLSVLSEVKVIASVPKQADRNEEANEAAAGVTSGVAVEAKSEAAGKTKAAGVTEPESATGSAVVAATEGATTTPESVAIELDMAGKPVLAKGKTVYLPIRLLSTKETFGWDVYYDAYYGLCVSTKQDVPAKTYLNETESLANKGLVNYIKSQNANISTSVAQHYVFLFDRAERCYGIEKELLAAIASKESHFNERATSRSGARGMMQIMPATANGYGHDASVLYDAKTNIDLASSIVSQRLKSYGGDRVKALSAYNQGASRVNRGTHSTVYADRILGEYKRISNYLAANGYTGR